MYVCVREYAFVCINYYETEMQRKINKKREVESQRERMRKSKREREKERERYMKS